MSIDLDKFDFGFTAVDEDELEVVQKQSQKLEYIVLYIKVILINNMKVTKKEIVVAYVQKINQKQGNK